MKELISTYSLYISDRIKIENGCLAYIY